MLFYYKASEIITSDKEVLEKLQEKERKAEYAVDEIIRKAEKLGVLEKMDRKGFQYTVLKRTLLMTLLGKPLNGYSELDLAIKSGVVDQHDIPNSLNYSVKGIPLDKHAKDS